MPSGDIYELSMITTLHGQDLANVYHYQQSGPDPTGSVDDELFQAFNEDVIPKWQLATSSEVGCVAVITRRIWPSPTPGIIHAVTISGSLSGASQPADSVVSATFTSANHTKKGRGRKFFSGITQGDVKNGTIKTGSITLWLTFAGVLWTEIAYGASTTTWKPGVYNRATSTISLFTGAVVRTIIKTLRSRTERALRW